MAGEKVRVDNLVSGAHSGGQVIKAPNAQDTSFEVQLTPGSGISPKVTLDSGIKCGFEMVDGKSVNVKGDKFGGTASVEFVRLKPTLNKLGMGPFGNKLEVEPFGINKITMGDISLVIDNKPATGFWDSLFGDETPSKQKDVLKALGVVCYDPNGTSNAITPIFTEDNIRQMTSAALEPFSPLEVEKPTPTPSVPTQKTHAVQHRK